VTALLQVSRAGGGGVWRWLVRSWDDYSTSVWKERVLFALDKRGLHNQHCVCSRPPPSNQQRLRLVVTNYSKLLISSRNLDFFTSFYRCVVGLKQLGLPQPHHRSLLRKPHLPAPTPQPCPILPTPHPYPTPTPTLNYPAASSSNSYLPPSSPHSILPTKSSLGSSLSPAQPSPTSWATSHWWCSRSSRWPGSALSLIGWVSFWKLRNQWLPAAAAAVAVR